MVNLILTDSYFNLFPILVDLIKKDANDLTKRNVIFCEAKVSLMIERFLCGATDGSFNTDVYSFGNFLRAKKKMDKILSKEGSAMAVKRVLKETSLKCFKQGKQNLSAAIYELIIQLKSAKITPEDALAASEQVGGVLKNKLFDIATVYSGYERFVTENGYDDQSSQLSYLPEIIYSSEEIKSANVYIVGYSGFTAQMRAAVESLICTAKSVTAIMTEGDNPYVYVNESAEFIRSACSKLSMPLVTKHMPSDFTLEARVIVDNLFSPVLKIRTDVNSKGKTEELKDGEKISTDKIYFKAAKNPSEEITAVAEIIKKAVLSGEYRYRDMCIAISNPEVYRDEIRSVFTMLKVPYFLDEQKVPENHPLITLITSYLDFKRKGANKETVLPLVKNPLFTEDKTLADAFENYVYKYNINYARFKVPFTFTEEENYQEIENLRKRLCELTDGFSIRALLEKLCVEEKLSALADALDLVNEKDEGAVTRQIYTAVTGILDEMEMILRNTALTSSEYKNVFLSGVAALRLSIIPQYNDAVFIGGYKEVALAKAKKLFAIGLTADVPSVREDIAMLSDGDISVLENIKVLVEPKIRVVNHRTREKVGMALSAFSEELYLSYPTSTVDGKRNYKSEVLTCIENTFTLRDFPDLDGYVTKEQGFISFAKACGEFAEGKNENDKPYDFTIPSSYSSVVGVDNLKYLLDRANKEIKERLDSKERSLVKGISSPTVIEEYYKCPYRAFLKHALKIKDREKGEVNAISVGNVMHEILKYYVIEYNKNNDLVTDGQSSDALFEKVKAKVLEKDEYKKFILEPSTKATAERVLKECKGYCYKTYLSLSQSGFSKCITEVGFGEGERDNFPPVKLAGGKVKLKGKIDRVDSDGKYFRVIDYKTGSVDAADKSLFAGIKLQLYLYAEAIRKGDKNGNALIPAGLYYLPISDKYGATEGEKGAEAVGKTLDDEQAVILQDKTFYSDGLSEYSLLSIDKRNNKIKNAVTKEQLDGYINYAVKVAEQAVERLDDGVIKPSPYDDACKYCEYSAMCEFNGEAERKIGSLNKDTFINCDKKGGDA